MLYEVILYSSGGMVIHAVEVIAEYEKEAAEKGIDSYDNDGGTERWRSIEVNEVF